MGREEELGNKLMKNFLANLSKTDDVPSTLLFLNSSAKLTYSEDEEIIKSLNTLKELGVDIATCKTCVVYYNYKEEDVKVGRICTSPEVISIITKRETITIA